MTQHRIAFAGLALIIAQFSINLGAAVAKSLFPLVGPEGVAALRSGIAALILLAVMRPWRTRITGRQAGFLLAYGLSLGGMNLLIYGAFQRIPIGVAIAIEISGPLTVVLLTSRSWRDFLWLALAVGSLMALIPWPGSQASLDPVGILLALAAAACWALYIVFGKRASTIGGGAAVALGMSISCLVTVPVGIATAGADLLQGHVLAIALGVALLSSALPYMLEMRALEALSSRLFGVLISGAPAVGALAGFIVLGERLSPLQWGAVAAMIMASAGCALTTRRPAPAEIEEGLA